ncbi:MAG: biotin transporter BioY [Actinobacteria bacterium]|nr:biotin transporter BioY [Actinomycetota bacterium]NBY14976.1 biotin transporter BioY [Actinomycetota bacterium]
MSAQSSVTVLGDTWVVKAASKSQTLVRNLGLVLGLTAFTALCAQVSIPLPFTPVPLTLQTFAVLAGAAALGAERAVVAQSLYVGLAWLGLPILAEHKGGSEVVTGVTGGYLVGFIVASYIVGRRAARGDSRNRLDTVAAFVAGSAAIYLLGVSWLAYANDMSPKDAIAAGMTPFLIGDVVKALIAGAVLPSLWNLTKSE